MRIYYNGFVSKRFTETYLPTFLLLIHDFLVGGSAAERDKISLHV